jgi:rhodanese-related sulfurtransferase
MKELNRTDRLTIASILAAIIIIIGFFTLKKTEIKFSRSVEQSIPFILEGKDIIFPERVAVISELEDPAYQIIDLRSPVEFQRSHIGKAINIPIQKILDEEYLDLFIKLKKDSIIGIIYSQDQLQANSAWMLLKQMGFDNLRVMPGGYNYYSTSSLDLNDLPAFPEYMVEKPKYDFLGVLDSFSGHLSSGNLNIITPEPVQLIKKEKKSQAEGGC